MREYGAHAESFSLAYDPAVYFAEPRPYAKKRVVFYARHETRRRGTELGLLALALLKRRLPDTEVVLFGSPELPYEPPFEYTSAGVLGERELADLYRGAAAGLSVSLTNYSLVPQEMLACGLPVVEMDLPPLRAAYPDTSPGIRLAPPTPAGIADALAETLTLPDSEARRAREAASHLVSRLSWSEAGRALVGFLERDGFDRGDTPDGDVRPTADTVAS
jgi:glycosyltransferase involved in cell wall biosynthesis